MIAKNHAILFNKKYRIDYNDYISIYKNVRSLRNNKAIRLKVILKKKYKKDIKIDKNI